ncbi:MAG: hypothetical protein ABIM73_00755, partial [Arenimonas sp.]
MAQYDWHQNKGGHCPALPIENFILTLGSAQPTKKNFMKAYDIKKGNVVEHNKTIYQVRDIERSSPQGRGGNMTFRFIMYSVPGGQKL